MLALGGGGRPLVRGTGGRADLPRLWDVDAPGVAKDEEGLYSDAMRRRTGPGLGLGLGVGWSSLNWTLSSGLEQTDMLRLCLNCSYMRGTNMSIESWSGERSTAENV